MLKFRFALFLAVSCLLVPACKRTTVQGPNAEKLTLVKPSDTSVRRGSTTKVAVSVKRSNVAGPVTVEFDALPKGVQALDSGSAVEGDERTFVLEAAQNADLVNNHLASVTVKGPKGISATEEFRITVREKS